MTGTEKILSLANLINDALSNAISGNEIEIHSGDVDGISTTEQIAILDLLSKGDSISYTSKPEFNSRDDLRECDLWEIAVTSEASGMSMDNVIDDYLDLRVFSIKALDTFRDTLTKLSSNISLSESSLPKNPVAIIGLNRLTNAVHIRIDGISKNIKSLKSKKSLNYIVLDKLLLNAENENKILSRVELGLGEHKSKVRNLPKMMGLDKRFTDIFFEIDDKKQTMRLHPVKNLSAKEAGTIRAYVNSKLA